MSCLIGANLTQGNVNASTISVNQGLLVEVMAGTLFMKGPLEM